MTPPAPHPWAAAVASSGSTLLAVTRFLPRLRFPAAGDTRPRMSDLERLLSALHGSAGDDALWLALAAAGVAAGDEVITTAFSFFATASSIIRAGARPVFVDIDPETLNLDPALVERKLKSSCARRRAILPVHLYGQCADMTSFSRLGAEYKLVIIEDAAQAVGATWAGNKAGSMASAAAFSFYPTKNLSAFGDAGALTTNDPELAERVVMLRDHGSRRRYYHEEIGANSRLDAIQAAVLRVKMPHLQQWNSERRQRAHAYDQLFGDSGLTKSGAASSSPVTLLKTRPETHHIYHQYVIRARKRDQLKAFLSDRGIGTQIYYPVPLHLQKCFAYVGYAAGDLPETEAAAAQVLALPMFAELRDEEQQYVVEMIAEFYS